MLIGEIPDLPASRLLLIPFAHLIRFPRPLGLSKLLLVSPHSIVAVVDVATMECLVRAILAFGLYRHALRVIYDETAKSVIMAPENKRARSRIGTTWSPWRTQDAATACQVAGCSGKLHI